MSGTPEVNRVPAYREKSDTVLFWRNLMSMMRIICSGILSLWGANAYAGICDQLVEPTSRKDWVLSNMCHFDNTVLVRIKSDYLREWYNPLTHFRVPNTFEYEVEILEVYKGQAPATSCMLESAEASFVISAGIKNSRQLVSFDGHATSCVVIDVAARQASSEELEQYASQVAAQLKSEIPTE